MTAGAWMRGNLTTEGYCLSDAAHRELAIGLRFSTGLCLSLVAIALALQSAVVVFALRGRRPRELLGAPSVRPSLESRRPAPRRRTGAASEPAASARCVQGGD
jgi:hypothetical protein